MSANLPVPEIILASTSPRRHLLLERIGLPHRIFAPATDEIEPEIGRCGEVALINAEAKALTAVPFFPYFPVLGADTIVDVEGLPLGKPKDGDDAVRMLRFLSGRSHTVHTAIFFAEPAKNLSYRAIEESRVTFRRLGDLEIEHYVATGEPLDKAGAYGIQERGSMLIERIEGCFFNVMGLPLARLWETMKVWMDERGTPLKNW